MKYFSLKIAPWVFVLIITGFSLLLRFAIHPSTQFPINDGGMFYTMTNELIHNHFILPMYTMYNHAHIPFTYPPLGFYTYGFLTSVFHIPLLLLITFLPTIISVFTIPVFYLFSVSFFQKKAEAFCATIAYAFVPGSFVWIIMGGGVTRAWGQFFAIATCFFVLSAFQKKSRLYIFGAAICFAFTILSHLAWALFVCISILFFVLRGNIHKKKLFILFKIFLLTGCFTSFWLIPILLRQGVIPFLLVFQSVNSIVFPISFFIKITNFTSEPIIPILNLFALVALFVNTAKMRFFLPAWFLISFFSDTHDSGAVAIIPFSLLAGIFIFEYIFPVFHEAFMNTQHLSLFPYWIRFCAGLPIFWFFFIVIIINITFKAATFPVVSLNDQRAFQWIHTHMITQKRFLVLTPNIEHNAWGSDSVSEWFPSLTNQQSILTLQGREWLPDHNMEQVNNTIVALSHCTQLNLFCLTSWTKQYNMHYQYLFLSPVTNTYLSPLKDALMYDTSFRLVFENKTTMIWKKI